MEKFQLYRNKLVHLNHNFSKEELNQLEDDIIHVIVYVLHILLSSKVSDKEYREFLSEYIEHSEYEKLLSNSAFYKALSFYLFARICLKYIFIMLEKCDNLCITYYF